MNIQLINPNLLDRVIYVWYTGRPRKWKYGKIINKSPDIAIKSASDTIIIDSTSIAHYLTTHPEKRLA